MKELLELPLTKEIILMLVTEDHFLANCRDKQDILSEGSEYFLCQSEDKKSWLLVQKIGGKCITLGSKYFNQNIDIPIVDLLLSTKKNEKIVAVDDFQISSTTPLLSNKRKRFQRVGMNQGWHY